MNQMKGKLGVCLVDDAPFAMILPRVFLSVPFEILNAPAANPNGRYNVLEIL